MTSDPPRRWPDDSPEEDVEAHRATELARFERSMAGEKTRPLAGALEAHGVLPADGDGWAGPLILPDWWDDIPAPANPCPACQRPGVVTRYFDGDPARPVPCPECCQALADGADPPATWTWWPSLPAGARRLHIAAPYGTDPWSGRRCVIRQESTSIGSEGEIRTATRCTSGPRRTASTGGRSAGAARDDRHRRARAGQLAELDRGSSPAIRGADGLRWPRWLGFMVRPARACGVRNSGCPLRRDRPCGARVLNPAQ